MQQIYLFTKQETDNKLKVSRNGSAKTKAEEYNRLVKLHGLRENDCVRPLAVGMYHRKATVKRIGEMGFEIDHDGVVCVFYWPDEGKTRERWDKRGER